MAHWVTKAELARRGKCNPSLITKKCKADGVWAEALSITGKIDLDNPLIVRWMVKREIVIAPRDITTQQFGEMTVNQIVENYGSVDKLEGYIKTLKLIAETESKKVLMAERRNELVSRDGVAKACFGFITASNQKLLEMPKGVIEQIIAIVQTETPSSKQESEECLTEEISKILNSVKKEVSDKLMLSNEQQLELEFTVAKEQADNAAAAEDVFEEEDAKRKAIISQKIKDKKAELKKKKTKKKKKVKLVKKKTKKKTKKKKKHVKKKKSTKKLVKKVDKDKEVPDVTD